LIRSNPKTVSKTDEPGARVREIRLPDRVLERVEQRVPRSDFESTSEYVTFVLEEVLERVEDTDGEEAHETVDESEVQHRLESLGYLEQ